MWLHTVGNAARSLFDGLIRFSAMVLRAIANLVTFLIDWIIPLFAIGVGLYGTYIYMFKPVDLEALKYILILLIALATSDVALRLHSFRKITSDIRNINDAIFRSLIDPAKATLLELILYPEATHEPLEYQGLRDMQDQFWSTEKTEKIEGKAHEIWVATPNLTWELDKRFRKTIFNNIKRRNIVIRQLYLKNDANQTKLDKEILPKLKPINGWEKKVKYVPVPPNEFIWYVEHVLYDEDHCILINLITHRHVPQGYNIELPPEMRREFAEQFIRLWDKWVDDSEWYLNKP